MKNPKPVHDFHIESIHAMHRLKTPLGTLYRIRDDDTQFEYFVFKGEKASCSCVREEKDRSKLCPHIKFLEKHPTITINGFLVDEDNHIQELGLVVVEVRA